MAFIRFKISYPPSYYKFLDLLCIIEKNDNYYLAHTYIFSISLYIYIYFVSTSILYHKWFDEVESNIPVKFREIWKKKGKKRTRSGIRGSSILEYKTKSDYERLNFPLIFAECLSHSIRISNGFSSNIPYSYASGIPISYSEWNPISPKEFIHPVCAAFIHRGPKDFRAQK